jgi:hypothetical protein
VFEYVIRGILSFNNIQKLEKIQKKTNDAQSRIAELTQKREATQQLLSVEQKRLGKEVEAKGAGSSDSKYQYEATNQDRTYSINIECVLDPDRFL